MARQDGRRILVEVLVALAFIVFLLIFVEPIFSRTPREKARMIQCINNQHQLVLAVLAYAQDNGETLPTSAGVWTDSQHLPYSIDASTLHCPDVYKLHNGYVFNNRLSGKKLSDATLRDTQHTMVTADGQHRLSPTPGESPNVAYSAADLDFRHNAQKTLIAGFLDGHVDEVTDPALAAGWFTPSP